MFQPIKFHYLKKLTTTTKKKTTRLIRVLSLLARLLYYAKGTKRGGGEKKNDSFSLHAFMHRLPNFPTGKNDKWRERRGMKPSHTHTMMTMMMIPTTVSSSLVSPSRTYQRRRRRHLTRYRTWMQHFQSQVVQNKNCASPLYTLRIIRCCGAWCVYNVSSTASLLCNPLPPLLPYRSFVVFTLFLFSPEPYFIFSLNRREKREREISFFFYTSYPLCACVCVCLLSVIVCVRWRRQLIHSFSWTRWCTLD